MVVLQNTVSRRRCEVVGIRFKSYPVADLIQTLLDLHLF